MSRMVACRLKVWLLITLLGTLGCGGGDTSPKPCQADTECSSNGWCLDGSCQTPYALTLRTDRAVEADGKKLFLALRKFLEGRS